MIEESDIAILAELHRMVVRFGPEAVSRLARLIGDPSQAEELAKAMAFVVHSSKRASTRPSASSNKGVDRVGVNVLKRLASSDPEKYAVLSEIRDQLLSGTTLQSMAEIRRFARNNALPIGTSSSRVAAVVPLLRALSHLPTSEISSIRDSMMEFSTTDRSLDRLRDVIVHSHDSRRYDSLAADDIPHKAQPR